MSGRSAAADSGWSGGLTPGSRPAVLVIDMMQAYFEPGSAFDVGSRACLDAASTLVTTARECDVPVVHTRVVFDSPNDAPVFLKKVPALSALIGGGPLSELRPEVAPESGERVFIKHYASGFFGTELAAVLREKQVDTTLVVGVSTSGCVRATALDSLQYGFIPLVVRDGVGDRDRSAHDAALHDLQTKYAEVIPLDSAIDYLHTHR